jgi:hypothetical protein
LRAVRRSVNDIHGKKYMIPVLWKGKEIMIPKIVNKSNDH